MLYRNHQPVRGYFYADGQVEWEIGDLTPEELALGFDAFPHQGQDDSDDFPDEEKVLEIADAWGIDTFFEKEEYPPAVGMGLRRKLFLCGIGKERPDWFDGVRIPCRLQSLLIRGRAARALFLSPKATQTAATLIACKNRETWRRKKQNTGECLSESTGFPKSG